MAIQQLKTKVINFSQDLSLLALRLVLAYGFYQPAMNKLNNLNGIATWFKSMGLIFPYFQAIMAASMEGLAVILLPLGLFTRWISIPSIFIMYMAIYLVHFKNGFKASENGFEIPFYYLLMFLVLFAFGAGKYSLDRFLRKK